MIYLRICLHSIWWRKCIRQSILDTRTCAAIVDEYGCGAEGKGLVGFGQPGTCKWVEKAEEGKMKFFLFFEFHRNKNKFLSRLMFFPCSFQIRQLSSFGNWWNGYQRNIISGKGPCRWKDGPSTFY